jgi:glycine dehydrogenase subunit 1
VRYIPSSFAERKKLLQALGIESVDRLFDSIPERYRLKQPLNLPPPQPEADLVQRMRDLSRKNLDPDEAAIFLGAGAYRHFIPAVVDHLISRAEFYSSYTPYQPEFSQGTLQSIFEFQTMICQLTGLDVANASLYDGASALAEGILLAHRAKRRSRALLAGAIHPDYLRVVRTMVSTLGIEVDTVGPGEEGTADAGRVASALGPQTAALVIQQPNFLGRLEDVATLAEAARRAGALCIVTVNEPLSLGILKAPGDCGADVVLGEAQSFGVPLSFGGPFLGFMAVRMEWVRELPGRLVGQARDGQGRIGYVLTLATREQHIRRERATSNICTNEGLCMLAATIFMATLGKEGLRDLALQNRARAEYAKSILSEIPGCRIPYPGAGFNEFVVELPRDAAEVHGRLLERGIVAGLPLTRYDAGRRKELLLCVTETNSRAQIDRLADELREVL